MMDSFELNKLIGAFLAVVFIVFSISIVSDGIFATHAPEQPGYAIEVPDAPAGGGEEEAAGPTIAELLQTADPAAGETAFRKCVACHTADDGGPNKVGPNLFDIVNRPVASHEGFSYSSAMRGFAEGGTTWTFEHLSEFLKAPRSYVPNTAMAFAGIRNPQEEANLLAYLRTLSDDPAPLPEVSAAEEDAAPADAAPADEDAAPADAAPAEGAEEDAAPAEGTEPARPATPDDGTSASPEADPGAPSGEAPADQ